MKDIYGEGLWDYFTGDDEATFTLQNDYGNPEDMPVEVFFYDEEDLTLLEKKSIDLCKGKVLDVGAGAGRHSLMLTKRLHKVKSIDISPLAVQLMQARGVEDAECVDIFEMQENEKFDTILLMMNGIGLAQKVENVVVLLEKLKKLLTPKGRIVFDSSDLAYLYEGEPLPFDKYYGEVKFRYKYHGNKSDWFGWVYVDQKMMNSLANKAGFNMNVKYTDEHEQYLAVLELQNN
ncbi:class I SAM-dependent methyltransferase [Aureibacter tunicatorum]|uniref:SAM-dependent methyltransferase n=1 Tax=Aureibacter tunicatorum TaxID=866807 RepID=A0AAE3XMY0_9BACT|nr:methyltransferase domain-containing protein [Aureibacter tunicatorum]MDR6239450.1 SAM-dependent methyltransferase [Aureibacter tunicatorum]BDD04627.1 methyltransferase [Aureibacter tunicatorum]